MEPRSPAGTEDRKQGAEPQTGSLLRGQEHNSDCRSGLAPVSTRQEGKFLRLRASALS